MFRPDITVMVSLLPSKCYKSRTECDLWSVFVAQVWQTCSTCPVTSWCTSLSTPDCDTCIQVEGPAGTWTQLWSRAVLFGSAAHVWQTCSTCPVCTTLSTRLQTVTRAPRSGARMHMDYTAMITYRARVPSFFSLSAVGIACRNYI